MPFFHTTTLLLLLLLLFKVDAGVECGIPCDTAEGVFDASTMTADGTMSCQAYLDSTQFASITCPFSFTSVEDSGLLISINTNLKNIGCCDKGYTTSCNVCPTQKINEDSPIDIVSFGGSFNDITNCGTFVDHFQKTVTGRTTETFCFEKQKNMLERHVPCCECDASLFDCAAIEAAQATPGPAPTTMAPTDSAAPVTFPSSVIIMTISMAALGSSLMI